MNPPVLEVADVVKSYGGLRPLRIAALSLAEGERVALIGPDQAAAEVFINLITGASVPDRGEVRLFGKPTTAIVDSAEWLLTVDRFGIVSERAVLLEALSVLQNLAVPFTLEIEPPPDVVRERAIALAREVGLSAESLSMRVGELTPVDRVRVRFARALALDPAIVVLEHPTAAMPRDAVGALGAAFRDVASNRGAATIALTGDAEFAHAVAARVLTLDAATGRLLERRRSWWRR